MSQPLSFGVPCSLSSFRVWRFSASGWLPACYRFCFLLWFSICLVSDLSLLLPCASAFAHPPDFPSNSPLPCPCSLLLGAWRFLPDSLVLSFLFVSRRYYFLSFPSGCASYFSFFISGYPLYRFSFSLFFPRTRFTFRLPCGAFPVASSLLPFCVPLVHLFLGWLAASWLLAPSGLFQLLFPFRMVSLLLGFSSLNWLPLCSLRCFPILLSASFALIPFLARRLLPHLPPAFCFLLCFAFQFPSALLLPLEHSLDVCGCFLLFAIIFIWLAPLCSSLDGLAIIAWSLVVHLLSGSAPASVLATATPGL